MGFDDLVHSAWTLFRKDSHLPPTININTLHVGSGSGRPAHKMAMRSYSSSSLSKTVFNRIATDAAMIPINHIRVVDDIKTQENIKSHLQECLSLEANLDQSAFSFFHDLIYSMLEEGVVAVVPTETNKRPNETGAFDIWSMRVGRITQWFPQHVQVEILNEFTGMNETVLLHKRMVAIIENPFYEVVNEDSSTLNRLKRKMQLLDKRDEEISAGKFNMIVQLPFALNSEHREDQAEARKVALEKDLADSAYGVAYIGATDKITQLNRPIDNDLADQVKYLRDEFYSQMGLTENVFNGTADEAEMNNYYARSIDPVCTVITQAFKRNFLTKTARSKGEEIAYSRDIFKLMPASVIAEMADKFTRNEILSPNEMRSIVGYRASLDPRADELKNRNIAQINQLDQADPYYEEEGPGYVDMNNLSGGGQTDEV